MITADKLEGVQKVTWCTGCGNFGILASLKKAVMELDVPHEDLVLISGIGCSSKIPHYINLSAMHTLHGRPIPVATGVHLVNQDLTVFVHTGDGDCLGEGLGHFVHAARRNVNMAVFIHNNGVNGLTKGQFSPSARRGYVSNTSPPPPGAPMDPVNPIALALSSGASFAARGFSGDQKNLVEIMIRAIKHRGFAVVDILQPCVTWNRSLTWAFYNKHTYNLQENGHDETDRFKAIEKSMEWGERIPTGIFFDVECTDLAQSLSLPSDGRLKEHVNDLSIVQQLIDEKMI
ncbi:MAG: thiamine pyrophosphate-dependent enzyme [Candidatus Thorarchaeota archaeon]